MDHLSVKILLTSVPFSGGDNLFNKVFMKIKCLKILIRIFVMKAIAGNFFYKEKALLGASHGYCTLHSEHDETWLTCLPAPLLGQEAGVTASSGGSESVHHRLYTSHKHHQLTRQFDQENLHQLSTVPFLLGKYKVLIFLRILQVLFNFQLSSSLI